MGRGLDDKKIETFKKSPWIEFFKEHKNELFLGVRKNEIHIYYKGMRIAKINKDLEGAKINRKYLGDTDKEGYIKVPYEIMKENDMYPSVPYKIIEENYEPIKLNIDRHIKEEKQNHNEKEVQQKLILKNNSNSNSNWVCIDMEYTKEGKDQAGRYDILAVSKKRPYRVAIIELKVGNSKNKVNDSISGKSGILKHAKDWNEFVEKSLFNKNQENSLLLEIINILNNNYDLNINGIKNSYKEEDFIQEPEFYFLICSGDKNIKDIKNKVGKYLWNENTAREHRIEGIISKDTITIQDSLKYDISKKGAGKLYCKFLFAEGYGDSISDIIDDENYETLN